MTVWTIQPLTLYEELIGYGTLLCDPKQEGFWGLISEEFQAAYDWLAEQMRIRLAHITAGCPLSVLGMGVN